MFDTARHSQLVDEVFALAPVIPVLAIDRLEDALPLCRALVDNGLPVLEITLSTACADADSGAMPLAPSSATSTRMVSTALSDTPAGRAAGVCTTPFTTGTATPRGVAKDWMAAARASM